MFGKILIASFFCLIIVCHTTFGQTHTTRAAPNKANEISVKFPNLKKQADEMAKAITTNDFDKFADFMYPKVIEMVGGREKFITGLKAAMEQVKSSGIESSDYVVENPTQKINFEKHIFSILPTETTIKTRNETINMVGGLIGISQDNGKNWTFIRIQSKEVLKRLFPKVADKLKIPVIGIK
ncbi:MAG TPA: hypothetical protein VNI84_16325 [Pyrinomonadaceae bacterium]|nr:hypothetical protein [Pyrinomonadaceae bacterium]